MMRTLEYLLQESSASHSHLCPRQILGVRIGLAGMNALGFAAPPMKKQLLAISETDGCFVDGLTAATGCTVGHRTLRVEDYGKVAVTFVDTQTDRALRVAPLPDIRERAYTFAPDEAQRYFAQIQAYQVMPDNELLMLQEVFLETSIKQILSRPSVRVNCDVCDEEVINNREILRDGLTLCCACDAGGYYRTSMQSYVLQSESLS